MYYIRKVNIYKSDFWYHETCYGYWIGIIPGIKWRSGERDRKNIVCHLTCLGGGKVYTCSDLLLNRALFYFVSNESNSTDLSISLCLIL